MEFDIRKMCLPVSSDSNSGCGTNEEYSPLFMELENLATGVQPSQMGDSIIEGRDPDWKKLQANCLELWKNTRDLRVAVYLSLAGFALRGLQGFHDGLELIRYLVRDLWDEFYPQLDPDDDNDPTERLNILSILSPPPGTFNDPIMFINHFRSQRLTDSNRYTLRDLMVVNGDLDAVDGRKIDSALFHAEMRAVPSEQMQNRKEQADAVYAALQDIVQEVDSHAGEGSLNFAALFADLKILRNFYSSCCLTENAAPQEAADTETGTAETSVTRPQTSMPSAAVNISQFVPSSRAEALLLLQKAAEYFQQAEPTSPVPFLVRRAMRMADMNFLDLLGEIESGAQEKGREIFGIRNEQNDED